MVGAKRLELLHLAALEPKSSASTNFATPPSGTFIQNKCGRGSRTRTLTNGFGDRHATITPILFQNIDDLTSTLTLSFNLKWWGRRDSNSYTLRRWNLNPVRLPISPRPRWLCILAIRSNSDKCFFSKKN